MRQSASSLLMVRPAAFQFNVQTAQSNEFQQNLEGLTQHEILSKAQAEFDTMVSELTAHKISVQVIEDTIEPIKPDAIFPNNWISMSQDGVLTIFPMKNENRQFEKRKDIIDMVESKFEISTKIDLSHFEKEDRALEGTGSIVYDHIARIAYACLSPRTDLDILNDYCQQINYQPVVFYSQDSNGKLIYHTNVVMCVGSGYVVIGLDTVFDAQDRAMLENQFRSSNLELISLTNDQLLHNFAGNMLQVENQDGELYLVMSRKAFSSLTESQKIQIEKYAQILPVSIDIIETIGGGSARCMMAEIFLQKK
jgi:hypothetical protein